MKRKGIKYGYSTNKTLRYCQDCNQSRIDNICENWSLNKKGRWKIVELLKYRINEQQSNNNERKIVVRGYSNFIQYNGYLDNLREHPPKHLKFNYPDFVYIPYVSYIKIDQDKLIKALNEGSSYLKNNNTDDIFDINSTSKVALIYILKPKHRFSSDCKLAYQHAYGGSYAEFSTVCTGIHCNLGAIINGHITSDNQIDRVLFMYINDCQKNDENGRWGCCRQSYSGKQYRNSDKEWRSLLKKRRSENATFLMNNY
ncbi:unnamed protein product [Didymodactylos carnosus]|uniref:Uncharacterized protein n=1 Tax=Didymodactylos carnosus TaxID=1234261 RepID=A0A814J6Y5_9BILA|nr:unnamed protein product [Didymodactylos carnosus]CAF1357432.1 unnamed protein product [Didymodactylos carnosus]CAF3804181.1 unnamed protein product [Didymodactylos carnosus]CAF4167700.1 unnamed protein product [Didymodactylos carnosus]